MGLFLNHIIKLFGEPVYPTLLDKDSPLGRICTDSRKLQNGDFYIPLRGENFDGHDFLVDVYAQGAQASLVEKKSHAFIPKGLQYWIVEDTLRAYQQIALLHRRDLGVPVIAVTGSTGKTTTKELIRGVLEPIGEILATSNNNNNDIGVPLTLFGGSKIHSAIVLEMGMRGLGEIQRLSFCSEPDVAVITNIGSAHIGRLGSRENIAIAKSEIISSLNPNGVVIIPANEPLLESVLADKWSGRLVRVSIDDSNSTRSHSNLRKDDLVGKLNLERGIIVVDEYILNLPLEGRHNAINFLLALAVAKEFDISFDKIKQLEVDLPFGRSKFHKIGGVTILDETYNSSPEAVKASLELLISQPGRHFAALGKMLELGDQSISLHKQVAQWVVDFEVDGLIVISDGPEIDEMSLIAKRLPCFQVVSTLEEASFYLSSWLNSGDTLLIKGSRELALDKLLPILQDVLS